MSLLDDARYILDELSDESDIVSEVRDQIQKASRYLSQYEDQVMDLVKMAKDLV